MSQQVELENVILNEILKQQQQILSLLQKIEKELNTHG